MIEITEISSFVHNDVNYYLTISTNYTYVFVNWKILRNRFRIHLQYLKGSDDFTLFSHLQN